jgi:hypothetical protein
VGGCNAFATNFLPASVRTEFRSAEDIIIE